MRRTQKKVVEAKGSVGGAVVRLVLTALPAVVILLVVGYLFAGTEGFRSLVESRLAEALGVPLKIGTSRALLNGDLVFGDVRTTNRVEEGNAGVHVARARVQLNWLGLVGGDLTAAVGAVEMDDWQVNFVPDADGRMQPAELTMASDWLSQWGGLTVPGGADGSPRKERTGAPEVPVKPTSAGQGLNRWKHTRFAFRRGNMEWWDGKGNVVVSVHDIAFFLTPLQLPTRPATHYHATVKSAVLPGGQRVRDMDLELLRTGETYLVLNLEAVRQTSGTAPDTPIAAVTPVPLSPPPRAEPIPAPSTDEVQQYIRGELEGALRGDP